MNASGLALGAAIAVPVVLIGSLLGFVALDSPPAGTCLGNDAPGVSVSVPTDSLSIGAYGPAQVTNAATIVRAGQDLNASVRDQTIAVMTAMGESSLNILDHGDQVGPDSRGLFQQRDNGAWGTYQDRMDPYTSASNFYQALLRVNQREQLIPSHAANRVQRNADPDHYTPFWAAAVDVVSTLSGTDVGLNDDPTVVCASIGTIPGAVLDNGWAIPGEGNITSGFGDRKHPIDGVWRLHAGTDFGGQCGAPIWAARAGIVTQAGPDPAGTGVVRIDHGDGLETLYLHSYPAGIFVRVGQSVQAGQHIAAIGSSGPSTGCHLHFEVHVNGTPVDPEIVFTKLGAPLR